MSGVSRWLIGVAVFIVIMLIARTLGIDPTLGEQVAVTIATTLMLVVMEAS